MRQLKLDYGLLIRVLMMEFYQNRMTQSYLKTLYLKGIAKKRKIC
jgi:hypothetical protein